MTWAARLASLSQAKHPYVESADSADRSEMGAIGANGAFDIGRESQNEPLPPLPPVTPAETDAEIETLAEALMAAHLSTSGCGVTDRGKALAYHRSEAMRRLDLIRHRAIDATTGDDPEREAIMAEEASPLADGETHRSTVAALLLATSPLAGVPGARRCPACGRGIWCSPSWVGPPPPDLCAECWASEREAGHERNPL